MHYFTQTYEDFMKQKNAELWKKLTNFMQK